MKVFITPKITTQNNYKSIDYSLDIEWYKYFKNMNINLEMIDVLDKSKWPKGSKNIIFSGGNDLYNLNKKKINKIRDESELLFLDHCLKQKCNILGVCRGFQLIAKYFGSKIVPVYGHVRKKHILNVSNSRYSLSKTISVNSYHNYGVREISDQFNIIAKSNDGIIEIAEHSIISILMTNFHPERENKSQKYINHYLKKFFK